MRNELNKEPQERNNYMLDKVGIAKRIAKEKGIDYKKTNDIGKFCDSIVYILIEKYIYGVIELVSLEQYGKYGDRPHVGIFTRHRNSGEKPKNSYHIIVQNYHVLDNINHNKFYTWLKSAFGIKIPDVLFDSGIIDTVGTKKTQNYALPFFTSKGYQLVKSIPTILTGVSTVVENDISNWLLVLGIGLLLPWFLMILIIIIV